MPVTCEEFYQSPVMGASPSDPDQTRLERVYKILGTLDETEALDALITTAGSTAVLNGVLLSKVEFDVDPTDYGVWTGTARYSMRSLRRAQLQEGESSYQFETGGGNIHISHSLATVQSVKAGGGTAPNFYGAIAVAGDTINGCDIISPVYNFSETHVLPASIVTGSYKLKLFRATGKVNANPFKGLAAGEVLFLGASGSSRGDDEWELTYRFAASENVSGLVVSGLPAVNKKGWEFLWLYFEDDVSENVLIKKPLAAYVEQVYQTHDFANIGIGV